MLPRAMMGEGCLVAKTPHPFENRGQTIVPSPALNSGLPEFSA
jgi:hypothetical protein